MTSHALTHIVIIMTKKIVFLSVFFVLFIVINISVSTRIYANTARSRSITLILQEFDQLSGEGFENQELEFFFDSNIKDRRIAILKAFFRRHESPLYDHADFIVKVSDAYELDFRLIPAIAMQESTACKAIPVNSYNCWGWGIYGTTVTRFDSYDDAIETVAKGIKENYIKENAPVNTSEFSYQVKDSGQDYSLNLSLK